MSGIFKISTFTKILILAIFLGLILNLISGGYIYSILELQSALVVNNLEFWRILSFPLVQTTIEGVLLFLITFTFFAPKLETVFHRFGFPIIILLVILLQGILSSLLFWKTSIRLSGMEGVSFFVLSLFTFVNSNKKLVFMQMPAIHTSLIVFTLSIIWAVTVAIHSLISGYEIILSNSYYTIFGLTTGLLAYVQINLSRNIRLKKTHQNLIPRIEIPKPEELSLALIKQKELQNLSSHVRDNEYYEEVNIPLTEENLNEILDKIHSLGKESLTNEENRFLENYSKML